MCWRSVGGDGMTIDEVTAQRDTMNAKLNSVKRQQQALKVKKASLKAQQAQQQLRAARAPAAP